MQRTIFRTRAQWVAVAVASVLASACCLDKQTEPSLIGPAAGGTSVFMAATPDRLPRDGQSQSVVSLEVRGPDGRAIPGRRVTLGVTGGTLSQTDVVTGSNGRTTFSVQAPTQSEVVDGNVITVLATPVATDFNNATTQTLAIALTGVSNSTAPTAQFTVTPGSPEQNQAATFDATTSTDEGKQCLDACTYQWNFDDGSTASGRVVAHTFRIVKNYTVTLDLTDASGLGVSLRKVVTVVPRVTTPPTANFVFSPGAPAPNQAVFFNAASSTAAAGHTLTSYAWDFGDGTTTSGQTSNHSYSAVGTF